VLAPPESACAGTAPITATAPRAANNGAVRIESEKRIDFTRITLDNKCHIPGTVG
jgi:hypothetical protein